MATADDQKGMGTMQRFCALMREIGESQSADYYERLRVALLSGACPSCALRFCTHYRMNALGRC